MAGYLELVSQALALGGSRPTWIEETRRRLLVALGDTVELQGRSTLDLWNLYLDFATARADLAILNKLQLLGLPQPLEVSALGLNFLSFALSGTAPQGTAGVLYQFSPTVRAGIAPIDFGYSGDPLPPEFTFNPLNGGVSAASPVAGSFSYTITATDAANVVATLPVTVTIV